MTTENDIRAFMQENRMPVTDGDSFMADLVRQIDLLPVPAAFDKAEELKRKEELDAVLRFFMSLRKRSVKKAVMAAVMVVVASLAAAVLVGIIPDSFFAGAVEYMSMPLVAFRYLLTGFISLVLAAFACESIVSVYRQSW